jgi:hypothetical protein
MKQKKNLKRGLPTATHVNNTQSNRYILDHNALRTKDLSINKLDKSREISRRDFGNCR